MKRIKLVHIITVPFQLVYFKGQIQYIKKRGVEIIFICSPGEELYTFCQREGVEYLAVDIPRRISPFKDLITIFQITKYLIKIKPDIVHAHTPKGGLLGMISATLAGVKVKIYHMRGLPYETAKGFKRFILMNTERVSCFLSNKTISVSKSLMKLALNDKITSNEKITVIEGGSSNGVDSRSRFNYQNINLDLLFEEQKRLGIESKEIVIGYVGRLAVDKGILVLLDAWNKLLSKYTNIRLLLVGPLDERDKLPEWAINQIENSKNINWLGSKINTEYYYALMKIFVLPTFREGLPNVLLEATSMGLPCVVTNSTGCVDVITNNENGLIVPVKDSNAMNIAIEKYITSEKLRQLHGKNARESIEARFDSYKIWDGYYTLYSNLL